jgi:hypothetical protein
LASQYPLTLAWEFYKLSGTPEYDHGDIGILVKRKLPDGRSIEGAGFLEAKIREVKSGRFKIPPKQSKRILTRSPRTQLLLYDHNPVPVLDYLPDSGPWNWYRYSDSRSPVSHGPVLPFDLAIAIGQFDGSLYRYCHSFAQQFTRRYFNLLDLDFRTKAIETVKGLPGKFQSPRIILVLRIASRPENLPEEVRQMSNSIAPLNDMPRCRPSKLVIK